MKKLILSAAMFLMVSFIAFSQGVTADCYLMYPEESFKELFTLNKKTVNVSKSGSGFNYEVILDVTDKGNLAEEKDFVYLREYGVYYHEMKPESFSVFINDRKIKCFSEKHEHNDMFTYRCKIPSKNFKLRYCFWENGHEIGGTVNGSICNWTIKNWNLSKDYTEEAFIKIYNDCVSLDSENITVKGKYKKNGSTFFLKSGYLHYKTNEPEDALSISCANFYSGCGGGSGAPTLPSIYNDSRKFETAQGCIYEFITAARIVEYELDATDDYFHGNYEALISLLESLDENELRLFRNAFYAKNGYIFDDDSLNEYFSTALCYFPDKSAKPASMNIKENETVLFEMIKAAERKESADDVFNMYKKNRNILK